MKSRILTSFLLIPLVWAGNSVAEDGFRPLFNEMDLEGWVRVNTAPSTWSVRDGMLICSGKPIGEMRTTRMYQNFILELEWRHMKPRGNAGVFVWADDITARGVPFHRSIEVQVLENAYGNGSGHTTHGDIFPIHGATMTPVNGRGGSRAFPTEFRSRPSPEWNHYRIECRDGEISLAVNGAVVTRGRGCSPRKGYICLESEGGIVHYRGIRIKELPETPVDPTHVAVADRGFRCLYNGIDLAGWKASGAQWKPNDWVLAHAAEADGWLATRETFKDIGFVVDVRLHDVAGEAPSVSVRGAEISIDRSNSTMAAHLVTGAAWNRLEGEIRRDRMTLRVNGQEVFTNRPVDGSATGPLRLQAHGPVDFANIYVRPLN